MYALSEDIKVGINLNSTSGRPLRRIGFVPSTTPGDATLYTSASTYYYLDSTGNTVLGQRGDQGRTPWTHTIDLQAAYTKKINANTLTFQVGIFNLLNSQTASELNEINDYSRSTTTVVLPGRVSLNYGLPTSYQPPRSIRLTTRYEFLNSIFGTFKTASAVFFLVRPAWANSFGCKSRRKRITTSEAKHNCTSTTECGRRSGTLTVSR